MPARDPTPPPGPPAPPGPAQTPQGPGAATGRPGQLPSGESRGDPVRSPEKEKIENPALHTSPNLPPRDPTRPSQQSLPPPPPPGQGTTTAATPENPEQSQPWREVADGSEII